MKMHLTLGVRDFEVLDSTTTGIVRRMVSFWKSETKHPRQHATDMFFLSLSAISPGSGLNDELRVKVRFLPLRINLHQRVVKFALELQPDGGAGPSLANESASAAPPNEVFFQSVDVRPIKVKIDYQPEVRSLFTYATDQTADHSVECGLRSFTTW